jgi:HAD superfamily hydrolase (TIGR01490 family)
VGCFLGRIGIVDADDFQSRNRDFAEQYKAGTLDVLEFLGFSLGLIANRPAEEIEGWRSRYMREVIEPAILPQARALVDGHRRQEDLCALVTATNTFVTAPIAAAFGIEHLVGSEAEQVAGIYTGKPRGQPSFREGKVVRTEEWLASLNMQWSDFDEIWFYSDSSNDIPLLEHATHPVATNPDPGLLALARKRQWPVIELFA